MCNLKIKSNDVKGPKKFLLIKDDNINIRSCDSLYQLLAAVYKEDVKIDRILSSEEYSDKVLSSARDDNYFGVIVLTIRQNPLISYIKTGGGDIVVLQPELVSTGGIHSDLVMPLPRMIGERNFKFCGIKLLTCSDGKSIEYKKLISII